MSNLTLTFNDTLFDYSKIREPLVAVPKSFLVGLLKLKKSISRTEPVKDTSKNSKSKWKLTVADILRSGEIAKKEWAAGNIRYL